VFSFTLFIVFVSSKSPLLQKLRGCLRGNTPLSTSAQTYIHQRQNQGPLATTSSQSSKSLRPKRESGTNNTNNANKVTLQERRQLVQSKTFDMCDITMRETAVSVLNRTGSGKRSSFKSCGHYERRPSGFPVANRKMTPSDVVLLKSLCKPEAEV